MAPRSRVAMRTLRPFLLPVLVAIGSLLVVSMAGAGRPAGGWGGRPRAGAAARRPSRVAPDQYSRYFSRGHGQRLLVAKDDRVAICTDCHGSPGGKPASAPTAAGYPPHA